jgi:hypothetical protein
MRGGGLAQIGHRADAETEARSEAGLPAGAWCGAFAYTQAAKADGFDPHWKVDMQGESGIRSALEYRGDMANTWIWAFDNWVKLREYHAKRGSERWYEAIGKAAPKKGIESGVSASGPFDLTQNPAPNEVTLYEMGPAGKRVPLTKDDEGKKHRVTDPTKGPKNKRVHGVDRWSIVDFEIHVYRVSSEKPPKPPTSKELAAVA